MKIWLFVFKITSCLSKYVRVRLRWEKKYPYKQQLKVLSALPLPNKVTTADAPDPLPVTLLARIAPATLRQIKCVNHYITSYTPYKTS